MHKEQVHGGLKLRAKLANASTEEKASELKSDYGWQVARTERSTEAVSSGALTEAARELLMAIMGAQRGSQRAGRASDVGTCGTNSR